MSKPLLVRLEGIRSGDLLVRLYDEILRDVLLYEPLSPHEVDTLLRHERNEVYAAYLGREAIGLVAISSLENRSGGCVPLLGVAKKYRGRGFSGQLPGFTLNRLKR